MLKKKKKYVYSSVFYRGINGSGPSVPPTEYWPNHKTVLASISLIANIACIVLKASAPVTFGVNIPQRLVSIIVHRKEYSKIAFEVAAVAPLFLPYGPLLQLL
jgi:hypothetical protein